MTGQSQDELTAESVAGEEPPDISPGESGSRFDWLIGAAAATMLIQNLVVTNAVKGMTLSALAIGLVVFRDLFTRPARLQQMLVFAVVFAGLQLASQLANAVLAPELWRVPEGLLISGESAIALSHAYSRQARLAVASGAQPVARP